MAGHPLTKRKTHWGREGGFDGYKKKKKKKRKPSLLDLIGANEVVNHFHFAGTRPRESEV